jgi:hypothetical protein
MNLSEELNQLLTELMSRLPELEWKINSLGSSFSSRSLPSGLFKTNKERTGAGCIEEIKADIEFLTRQNNKRSAFYLAKNIQRKVNVLVTLCQLYNSENKIEEKVHFRMKTLTTRQQWVSELEADIRTLEQQEQALNNTLVSMTNRGNLDGALRLKADLGEIERHLTLAREQLKHMSF